MAAAQVGHLVARKHSGRAHRQLPEANVAEPVELFDQGVHASVNLLGGPVQAPDVVDPLFKGPDQPQTELPGAPALQQAIVGV